MPSWSLMLTNISKSVPWVSLIHSTSTLHVTFLRATKAIKQLLLEPPNDKPTSKGHVYASPLCSCGMLLISGNSNNSNVFRINTYKYLHSPS